MARSTKASEKQKRILEYIKECLLSRGYPPTVREICEAVGLKSTSSVYSHLEQLEANGLIRRDPTKPRAIEIVDDDFNLSRREVVNVPLIGTVAAGAPNYYWNNLRPFTQFMNINIGITETDTARNPFDDWNFVVITYATGDFHVGQR